jgi:MFS family permease
MKGNEFNNISTVFYATYVACETPWVICAKRYGANKIIAIAFVGWGLTTLGTGFIKNYHQVLAMRLLLGVFESCYIPTIIFMISQIYDRSAVAKRITVLYIATTVSGALGGLIAYGIQTMGEVRALAPWRWLFIIEGIISIVLCFAEWVSPPKNAENAWFLNQEEKAVMQARKERDVAFKGDEEGFS